MRQVGRQNNRAKIILLQLYKTIWQSEKMKISVNYHFNISKTTAYLALKTGRRSSVSLLILFLLLRSSRDYSGFCRCLCDGRGLGQYQYKFFVHTSFPGTQDFPQITVCVLFLPPCFPPHLTEGIGFFRETHLLYQLYQMKDIFNIHKTKFCLKSTCENTRSSSLKTLILKTEQSSGSFLYCSCLFFPLLRQHCASL